MTSPKFTYMPTKIGFILATAIALGALTISVIFGMNPNAPQAGDAESTEYPTELTSLVNGCGNFFVFQPVKGYQYAELTPEVLDRMGDKKYIPEAQMAVPVYGYLDSTPLEEKDIRFYEVDEFFPPLPLEKILRTMYSYDTLVIWYNPENVASTDLSDIRKYAADNPNTLVVPYIYKNGKLPLDRNIAFSKWGISQSCQYFNENVINTFTKFTLDHPPTHQGEELPPARFIKDSNSLYPIQLPSYNNRMLVPTDIPKGAPNPTASPSPTNTPKDGGE